MRIIYDTNVLLDYLLERGEFKVNSEKVVFVGFCGMEEGFITSSIVTDLYYFYSREVGNIPAQERIEALVNQLSVITVTADDIKESLKRRWDDMEDCLLSVCAEKVGGQFIITRNVEDFKKSSVKAITPEQYFEWCESNNIHYELVDY
jgi:predicted nucleic-acid-binding protein